MTNSMNGFDLMFCPVTINNVTSCLLIFNGCANKVSLKQWHDGVTCRYSLHVHFVLFLKRIIKQSRLLVLCEQH